MANDWRLTVMFRNGEAMRWFCGDRMVAARAIQVIHEGGDILRDIFGDGTLLRPYEVAAGWIYSPSESRQVGIESQETAVG